MIELRDKNRQTVTAFLAVGGPKRAEGRAPLFSEDAVQEVAFPAEGDFEYRKNEVGPWLVSSVKGFPEWSLYDSVIFESEDPEIFLVRCRGFGAMVTADGSRIPVEHFYINEFRMRDGKITLFRETPNPCEEFDPYVPGNTGTPVKPEMPDPEAAAEKTAESEAVRRQNLQTITTFLSSDMVETDRLAPLFAEDGVQELGFPTGGGFEFRKCDGRQWLADVAAGFITWKFGEPMIFKSDDPEVFLVRAGGAGLARTQDGTGIPMAHFYVVEFRMRDGKIALFREVPNPCEEFNPYSVKQ